MGLESTRAWLWAFPSCHQNSSLGWWGGDGLWSGAVCLLSRMPHAHSHAGHWLPNPSPAGVLPGWVVQLWGRWGVHSSMGWWEPAGVMARSLLVSGLWLLFPFHAGHWLKAGDLSREAETQGAWAQGCGQNGLLGAQKSPSLKGLVAALATRRAGACCRRPRTSRRSWRARRPRNTPSSGTPTCGLPWRSPSTRYFLFSSLLLSSLELGDTTIYEP